MKGNTVDFGKMRDSQLRSICNLGRCYQFREMARLELAGRGYSYYEGMEISDPESGNGQVTREEVKRVRDIHIRAFNAQGMAKKLSETVRSLQQQEEIKMIDQQHRSDEQIERIKKDMKKMSDDQLRSMFACDGDRQFSMLAHWELMSRSHMPSVYEVTLLTAAMGGNVTSSRLKRTISSEYVESLLDVCDEVRIRKVEVE